MAKTTILKQPLSELEETTVKIYPEAENLADCVYKIKTTGTEFHFLKVEVCDKGKKKGKITISDSHLYLDIENGDSFAIKLTDGTIRTFNKETLEYNK